MISELNRLSIKATASFHHFPWGQKLQKTTSYFSIYHFHLQLFLTWLLVILLVPPLSALITSLVSPAPCQQFNCHHLHYGHLHFLLTCDLHSGFPSLFWGTITCCDGFNSHQTSCQVKAWTLSDYWLRCWESLKLQRRILTQQKKQKKQLRKKMSTCHISMVSVILSCHWSFPPTSSGIHLNAKTQCNVITFVCSLQSHLMGGKRIGCANG